MAENSPLLIYITAPTREDAVKIADSIIEKRLAACANIFPAHEAVYRWKGKMEHGKEVAAILKTRAELYEQVEAEIMRLHPAEMPCVIALPVETGHEAFLDWIAAETA